MPTHLETEISSLFRDLGDANAVADELLKRWGLNLLDDGQQADCAQFLLSAGLYPKLFKQVRKIAEGGGRIPWAQFAEALGRSGIQLDTLEVEAILAGAEAQQSMNDLILSRELDKYEPALAEARDMLRFEKSKELLGRKQGLRDKLQFMRANRLFDEEAKVIAEIQAIFPDETGMDVEKESLKLRWAREVIANSSTTTDPTSDLQWKIERLPPEQAAAKAMIVERAKELAAENPERAYDLAITLQMMDFPLEALSVLEFAPARSASDWLRLELLVQARQYASVLDEATRLEIEYAGEPESAFAAVYARARALRGLGQGSMAVDLMRSLVRIRPQYKSAQSLLMDWSGDDA